MIHKILLAANGPGCHSVADAVVDIAENTGRGVDIEVLHVNDVEYQSPPSAKEAEEPDFTQEARRQLDQLVDDLCRRGLNAHGHVRSGVYDDIAEDIVAEAREQGAGLIVVGCRPRSDLSCWITGSVSHGVLRRASCPVLVVRENGAKV